MKDSRGLINISNIFRVRQASLCTFNIVGENRPLDWHKLYTDMKDYYKSESHPEVLTTKVLYGISLSSEIVTKAVDVLNEALLTCEKNGCARNIKALAMHHRMHAITNKSTLEGVAYPIQEFIKEYKLLEQMTNDDISKSYSLNADKVRINLSGELILAKEYEEAAALLEQLTSREKPLSYLAHDNALRNLFHCYIELGDREKTSKILEQRKEFVSRTFGSQSLQFAALFYDMARFEYDNGNPAEALIHANAASKILPKNSGDLDIEYRITLCFLVIGLCHFQNGNPGEAVQAYRDVIKHAASNFGFLRLPALYRLGCTQLLLEQWDEAEEALIEYLVSKHSAGIDCSDKIQTIEAIINKKGNAAPALANLKSTIKSMRAHK